MLGLSEMLKRGGNLESEELNKLAQEIVTNSVNEHGVGTDIKILEYIDVIKEAFCKWKNANLQKFQQLHTQQAKDVGMILDKIHTLQKNIRYGVTKIICLFYVEWSRLKDVLLNRKSLSSKCPS